MTAEQDDRLALLAYDYHVSIDRPGALVRPLLRATRDEWVARFRAIVGTRGHDFKGRPSDDHVIRLWRGTELEEHRHGLSWTPARTMAIGHAPNGQLWRIDSVPLNAILYYDPTAPGTIALPEVLIDTTGLHVVRELVPVSSGIRVPSMLNHWAHGPNGDRRWGPHGAAGLLLHDPARGVLLQQRSIYSDRGGTWSIPGGACEPEEAPVDTAFREAREEIGLTRELARTTGDHVLDLGWWRYTTVIAEPVGFIDVIPRGWESSRLEWVPTHAVPALNLHPDFALSWPSLATMLNASAPA
ncbi:NUDIX domain-containing protein [Microbacterium sp. TNHR37B]|uniref:NUDIX domain-containing protein n=1 Tax=Microbacterium sp. TNHR37B TaxID=1775956 RepID=UPI0007B1EA0C|nr:NUDIX hydrolase [Microbacterium sp. TNHR37B]KZE89093.1 putative 8-oxo-dGTP diphosphatase 3 [Microbacterium sp. TNHR37B]